MEGRLTQSRPMTGVWQTQKQLVNVFPGEDGGGCEPSMGKGAKAGTCNPPSWEEADTLYSQT